MPRYYCKKAFLNDNPTVSVIIITNIGENAFKIAKNSD